MQSSSWRGCLPRVRAGVRVVMKCWADKKQSRHTRGRLAQAGLLGTDLVQLRSPPQPTSRRQPGLEPYTLDQPPAPGGEGGWGDTASVSAPPGLATDLAILHCAARLSSAAPAHRSLCSPCTRAHCLGPTGGGARCGARVVAAGAQDWSQDTGAGRCRPGYTGRNILAHQIHCSKHV